MLALAAPKGLLILRDELAGWFKGMTAYNEAGRAFWIEAYGGRPYRVERVKHPQPIDVPRLAVSVLGGTQPDKLVEMMDEADDGLLARMCWFWPDPVAFHLASVAPATEWAIAALDRLRLLDLATESADDTPAPLLVPLSADARADMETFGQDMQARQQEAAGLMRSACGKARGTVLRLSLVMEYLWWCASEGMQAPPKQITGNGFAAAAALVSDYLMPMSERVYGDAATSAPDRNAATLARWIVKQRPAEVNVRKLQREVRLPGLSDAASIHEAAGALVEAGWLAERLKGNGNGRPKASYAANPHLWTVAP